MAEKKSMSTLAAKAVALLKEQGASKWGTGEHLACLRYMTSDAYAQAVKATEKEPDLQKRLAAIGESVNAQLKAAFKEDPELGYASNFQKLLEKAGEIKVQTEYK